MQENMPEQFISATIVRSGDDEGLTDSTTVRPADCSVAELEARLIADMAGKAAELLLTGESHGHEGDIEAATANALELLRREGRRARG
ncbi:hypothetical protein niasHT_039125 [Heterodera trifolii]|uniref:Uncharacterized protein n=1 Tax=Heterodera trifolii TaxID=157864 RepID=A0ABD2I831_9BILA